MEPLISVIVPIYNVEAYLDRCVESIVNQTYKNLEIILVDDGSPDKCPQMCDNWADKDNRIKVIHKENGGLSDARNAGMKIASGEYICFVDSDDLVALTFVEQLYNAITDKNANIVACDVLCFKNEKEIVENDLNQISTNSFTPEQALSQLIKGKGVRAVAWNKLYKREIIQDEQFEVGKLHEDEFYTYRLIDKCQKVVYVNCKLYYYRQREGSIMAVQSEKHIDTLEAGLYRLQLLKKKYPDLFLVDRVTFCIGCLNYYRLAQEKKFSNNKSAKSRIIGYRKQVKCSLSELKKYCFKDKMYIVFSNPKLIWLGAKLR